MNAIYKMIQLVSLVIMLIAAFVACSIVVPDTDNIFHDMYPYFVCGIIMVISLLGFLFGTDPHRVYRLLYGLVYAISEMFYISFDKSIDMMYWKRNTSPFDRMVTLYSEGIEIYDISHNYIH